MKENIKEYLKNNPSVTVSIKYVFDEFEVRLSNYHTNKHAYIRFSDFNEMSIDRMVSIVNDRFGEELLE